MNVQFKVELDSNVPLPTVGAQYSALLLIFLFFDSGGLPPSSQMNTQRHIITYECPQRVPSVWRWLLPEGHCPMASNLGVGRDSGPQGPSLASGVTFIVLGIAQWE